MTEIAFYIRGWRLCHTEGILPRPTWRLPWPAHGFRLGIHFFIGEDACGMTERVFLSK